MVIEYQLLLSDKFDKAFSQLDRITQERIIDILKNLSLNPELGKILKGKLKNLRSLRVGNYRILYQVNKMRLVVLVVELDHRKEFINNSYTHLRAHETRHDLVCS